MTNKDENPNIVDVDEAVEGSYRERQAAEAALKNVANPGTLIRIATMLQAMLDEARQVPFDESGRRRLREIHSRAVDAVKQTVSGELREELSSLTLPFEEGVPTASELRIAQAQLLGWLDGLFRGIQAAVFSQQMTAQRQLQELGRGKPGPQGQYL